VVELPIIRAAYLNLIVDVLRACGKNHESALRHFNLPDRLAEKPDAYVPLKPVLALLQWTVLSADIEDVALRAGSRLQISDFSAELHEAILGSRSLDIALDSFRRLASREQSWARYRIVRAQDRVLICGSLDELYRPPCDVGLDWLQIMPLIAIIRHFAGNAWAPASIAFRAPYASGVQARRMFPSSRFLVGQVQIGITFPSSELGLVTKNFPRIWPKAARRHPTIAAPEPSYWDFPACLRAVLLPYLEEGPPNITLAAKIVSCGVRTLQRRLHHFGLSYTDVVQQAMLGVATQVLRDPKTKVIDAANAVGFNDPSHFSRAFRRLTGASPTQFRVALSEEALIGGALATHSELAGIVSGAS